MQSTPLFYKNIIPLDRNQHGKLSLEFPINYRYATHTNSVFLTTTEFERACREYPIAFGSDGNGTFPMAIVGLRAEENLFVSAKGDWDTAYVPAYVRRYPFIFSTQPGSDGLILCIDSACVGLNDKHQGRPLFEGNTESAFLKEFLEFLKDFQTQAELTMRTTDRLQSLGILESISANIEFSTGTKFSLEGLSIVNRKQLAALSHEQLADLVRDGTMELIHLHLYSLNNFAPLGERLAARTTINLATLQVAGHA